MLHISHIANNKATQTNGGIVYIVKYAYVISLDYDHSFMLLLNVMFMIYIWRKVYVNLFLSF